MKKICAIAAAVAAFSCFSVQAANSPTGYTEDQLRQQAELEAQLRDFDPRNASINEMVAHAAQVDREREASLARGMNRYAEDPEYITRSIQAFKQVFPYASITDFENFIKSDETLKAYYTGTDAFRSLNRDQMYSDYRQFFPEQENFLTLEDKEDTNWVKSGKKVVKSLISPYIYADSQQKAVDYLNKFPKEEIEALKAKQLRAYKISQELKNLKASNWYDMTDADRNRTVQKINAYKKALNNLKPTAREQQLIDSGVVSAYDRAMNYKLALDKERAEFEGN